MSRIPRVHHRDADSGARGAEDLVPPEREIRRLDALIAAERVGEGVHGELGNPSGIADPAALPSLAVVFPDDEVSVLAAARTADDRLARPTLYGDGEKILALWQTLVGGTPPAIVDCGADPRAAAAAAVRDTGHGTHQIMLKGSIKTHELLQAVLSRESALRSEQRLTHTFLFDVAEPGRLLGLTDAAVNVAPDLDTAQRCIENALSVFHALNFSAVNVAVLAASESVRASVPATAFAQQLTHRIRQLTRANDISDESPIYDLYTDSPTINGSFGHKAIGLRVDGPLSLDAAVSPRAAHDKGIASDVAGIADLLVAHNLEAGSVLYKSLIHFARAQCAGVVHGARVPIALTSRVDSVFSRVASVALAKRLATRLARV